MSNDTQTPCWLYKTEGKFSADDIDCNGNDDDDDDDS